MTLSGLDPKPALVVIDLQKGVLSRATIHPLPEVIARAASLASAFRAKRLPVVLVNVKGAAPGRNETPGMLSTGVAPPPDWADLVDELDVHPDDHRVTKIRWGAFHGTPLDALLQRLGVTQIVLAGVSTSIGVETTARSGYEHGYNIVLATDAMTDADALAHENAIERIFPKLGERATTDEVIAALDLIVTLPRSN